MGCRDLPFDALEDQGNQSVASVDCAFHDRLNQDLPICALLTLSWVDRIQDTLKNARELARAAGWVATDARLEARRNTDVP